MGWFHPEGSMVVSVAGRLAFWQQKWQDWLWWVKIGVMHHCSPCPPRVNSSAIDFLSLWSVTVWGGWEK